ncbi:protein kinase domain-containing protein [Carnobacterium maltaromaticum]|uniref:protein kinase domain-containing protein n=1 Tax=Carnobacterium maltaromaticum TaxID=2751 RepID=UPI0039AF9712
MISNSVLRELSNEFIGETESSLYNYKTGPVLVEMFNDFFDENDSYGQGFPSRWIYVSEKLEKFETNNELNNFFQQILSSKFLRIHEGCNRGNVEASIVERIKRFNEILDKEDLEIKYINKKVMLMPFQDDLSEIGSGGFAIVYNISNNHRARKVLRLEFQHDEGVKHRFKREYEITKDLQEIDGIIPIFGDYNASDYSYEMQFCETNLEDYIRKNELNVKEKTELVKTILNILTQVHQRNTIHRDLSPNNILINNSKIYIADFGIGKDFNGKYSHQTMHTRDFGQFRYAAPEQLENLTNSTARSDVYSLGKVINFIFNKNPDNSEHIFTSFCEKATARNSEYRYENSGVLFTEIEKYLNSMEHKDFEEQIHSKMNSRIVDEQVSSYVLTLNESELSNLLVEKTHIVDIYMKVLENNPNQAFNLLSKLSNGVRSSYSWSDYDLFSSMAFKVLSYKSGFFDYDSNVKAAELLWYTANEVNRFDAQSKISSLIENGLEPSLEEILK